MIVASASSSLPSLSLDLDNASHVSVLLFALTELFDVQYPFYDARRGLLDLSFPAHAAESDPAQRVMVLYQARTLLTGELMLDLYITRMYRALGNLLMALANP